MNKELYFPPEAEVIETRVEVAFLTGTTDFGRADTGYEDNEMEGL